jgi:hypothetical protein
MRHSCSFWLFVLAGTLWAVPSGINYSSVAFDQKVSTHQDVELDLSIGTFIPSVEQLGLASDVFVDGRHFNASESVLAGNITVLRSTVELASEVSFSAGSKITLGPGFLAKKGSTFSAKVGYRPPPLPPVEDSVNLAFYNPEALAFQIQL